MNEKIKLLIVSVLLGLLFAYLSVIILGYSAAYPVPEFAQSYPIMAISAIDLIVAGIPLAIVFSFSAQIIKRVGKNVGYLSYILLALPFFVISIFFGSFGNFDFAFFAATIPKHIVIVFCIIYFAKRQGVVKA